MRERNGTRVVAALLVLLTASAVRSQCVQTSKAISQPAAFPSLVAGPIANSGSSIGLAKSDTSFSLPPVYFAVFDYNFNQITTDRQVAPASINGPYALFWTGTEFGLFYLRTDYTLILQRIDGSGSPIGTPIAMPHPWSSNDHFDVAWSPALNGYTVAHLVTFGVGFDTGLFLSVIASDGAVVRDTSVDPFASPRSNPRVLALSDGTVGVLWTPTTSNPPITQLALANLGTGTVKLVEITSRTISEPRLATNGSAILIVYASALTGGGSELRYSLVSTSGTLLTADAALLKGSGIDVLPLSLMWNPTLSEWALVYTDASLGLSVFPGETRLRRFASPTGLVSDTLLSPDPLRSRMNAPFPILFMNGGYVGTIQRVISLAVGSESYLVRLCPFFVTAAANPSIGRPFVPVTFSATPSGGTPGFSYAWQFGDNDSASGAVVHHAYVLPGIYTVTLSGSDASGAVSTARITVLITTSGGRQRSAKH